MSYPKTIDAAFALVSIAEATHSLYMARTILDRLQRDERGNLSEALKYAEAAEASAAAAVRAIKLAGGDAHGTDPQETKP